MQLKSNPDQLVFAQESQMFCDLAKSYRLSLPLPNRQPLPKGGFVVVQHGKAIGWITDLGILDVADGCLAVSDNGQVFVKSGNAWMYNSQSEFIGFYAG